jgi:hypothetical protein
LEQTDVSEVRNATFIKGDERGHKHATETSVYSTRLHDSTSQTALIYILAAVGT